MESAQILQMTHGELAALNMFFVLVLCLVKAQDFLIGVPSSNCIHEPFKYSILIH
jgi:hypothetical protein